MASWKTGSARSRGCWRPRASTTATARAAARLWVAVGRGLLLDVLATGDNDEVDAAMRFFADMMLATWQARLSEPPAD